MEAAGNQQDDPIEWDRIQGDNDDDHHPPQHGHRSRLLRHRPAAFWMDEASGACGDFGTLIPLLVAMARMRVIYLAPTLFLSGIVHIATGFYFNIPMPLQPMKAIASLAIAGELSKEQVTTAGVGMGLCFLVLGSGVGNLIEILNRWTPASVIGGLQLGVGWKLALKGIHMIQGLPWWFSTSLDCITLAILCSLLCLYGLRPRRQSATTDNIPVHGSDEDSDTNIAPQASLADRQSFYQRLMEKPPVGILLFLIGIVLAGVELLDNRRDSDGENKKSLSSKSEPLLVNALHNATATDWRVGILSGTLTQFPLTTLNSCLSVCLLVHTLFPSSKTRRRVSRRSVCLSIGLINVVLCPLGCMPTCHGAGGLAGQHRLGANTGVSMVLLGIFKTCLGFLAMQGGMLRVLDALPLSVLGVLLVLAGHELASTGVSKVAKEPSCNSTTRSNRPSHHNDDDMAVCLITALVIVGTGHTHVGALSGWITSLVYGVGRFSSCCGSRRWDGEDLLPTSGSTSAEYAPLEQQQQQVLEPVSASDE